MRLFGVLVVSLFVLTLLFAVAAGAQEESAAEETTVLAADAADRKVEAETDNVSVKVDNGEVSVSTDDGSSSDDGTSQQSSLTVQQTQTDEGSQSQAASGDLNATRNSSCQNPRGVRSVGPTKDNTVTTFKVEGRTFRVTYDVTLDDRNNTVNIDIEDRFGLADFETVEQSGEDSFISTEGP